MTKKYNETFRRNAVELLHDLSLDSCFTHDNIQIKNVRQLCAFLNISTNTLYRWQKEFSIQVAQMNDDYDEGFDIHESESDFDDIHYEKETRIATKGDKKISNGKYKKFKTTESEKKAYGERVEKEIQGFLELPVLEKNIVKEKVIFNQRYYGWFAGMLGVKRYSNMLVPQLKVAIGLKLIEQSGLIDMKKGIAKIDWLHEIGWVNK